MGQFSKITEAGVVSPTDVETPERIADEGLETIVVFE